MATKKLDRVNIIQLIFKPDNSNNIFGLGDDSLVYLYDATEHSWILWA